MTVQTSRVVHGWLHLSQSERADFINQLDAYLKMSPEARRRFEQQVESTVRPSIKMAIGPLTSPCPCCGK